MQRNNLISDKQYGFFPGRANTLQLLDEWNTRQRRSNRGSVYGLEDFGKVPDNRLKQKI